MLGYGAIFSVAHLLVFGFGAAIGGSPQYVRGISTADGSVRAVLRRSHWLGETQYHLYLTDPSPAPPFGRRLTFHGTDLAALATAATADLQALPDDSAVGLYADGVPVAAFDPATGDAKLLSGNTRGRRR